MVERNDRQERAEQAVVWCGWYQEVPCLGWTHHARRLALRLFRRMVPQPTVLCYLQQRKAAGSRISAARDAPQGTALGTGETQAGSLHQVGVLVMQRPGRSGRRHAAWMALGRDAAPGRPTFSSTARSSALVARAAPPAAAA